MRADPPTAYPVTMVQAAQDGPVERDVLDLRTLVATLWRGKWIVVICTLMTAVMGFLAASQITPTYRADAKVMFDIQQANIVNLEDVLTDQQFDRSRLEDEMEVLRSTSLIERVIADLALDENPAFNPALRPPEPSLEELVLELVPLPPEVQSVLMDFGILTPPAPPRNPLEEARRQRLQVIGNVREELSLDPVGRSRVIQISFVSDDPRTSAQIVNSIAEQYIVDQLEAKLETTRSATSWLSTRVDELRIRVQRAEEAVEAARGELSEATGQTLEVTQQQLEALNGALAGARAEASRLEGLYNRLADAVENDRDLGAISEFRNSALIQRYRQQEDELNAQRLAVVDSLRAGHPVLVRLDTQLVEVRSNIAAEAARIVEAAEIDLRAARAQEASLTDEVRRLEQKALAQSGDQLRLRQLDRQADASRVLYENFLGRLQETSEQEDLQQADARILSPAEIPLRPESEAKKRIVAIATVLGGMIGIGIVFLLDRLNNTFRAPGQLEELTGEQILGVLPSLGKRVHRREVISHLREKPSSSMAEAIRNLRTSILFSNIDTPPKVLMFTSSVPREGKSTSSILVALTSRQMGKSAIIVDCDLRLPALSRLLDDKSRDQGLISVLDGTATLEEAIFTDPDTGLHVLMTRAGERKSAANAADILASNKFRDLVQALAAQYDLVILDTPPTLVVTDARIVSKLADAVVYAVRWDSTPRGAVLEGLKELKSIDAPLAGLVMTQVNESKASNYSYEGYSYYKGKYKDYYTT